MNEIFLLEGSSGRIIAAVLAIALGKYPIKVLTQQEEIVCYAISPVGWQELIDRILDCHKLELERPYHRQRLAMLTGLEGMLKLMGADEALANLPKR